MFSSRLSRKQPSSAKGSADPPLPPARNCRMSSPVLLSSHRLTRSSTAKANAKSTTLTPQPKTLRKLKQPKATSQAVSKRPNKKQKKVQLPNYSLRINVGIPCGARSPLLRFSFLFFQSIVRFSFLFFQSISAFKCALLAVIGKELIQSLHMTRCVPISKSTGATRACAIPFTNALSFQLVLVSVVFN